MRHSSPRPADHNDPETKAQPVSRRLAIGLMVCAPIPLFGIGATGPSADFEFQLRQDLAAIRLPFQPARLDLVRLTMDEAPADVNMSAVVRMTWPPGVRQYPFLARATDATAARSLLVEDILKKFSSAI